MADDVDSDDAARAARREAFRRIRRFRASLKPVQRRPRTRDPSGLTPATRTILAALCIASPEPVPMLTLALLVWPDRPERRSMASLQNHVSNLRAALLRSGAGQEVQSITRDGVLCYRLVPAGSPRMLRVPPSEG